MVSIKVQNIMSYIGTDKTRQNKIWQVPYFAAYSFWSINFI